MAVPEKAQPVAAKKTLAAIVPFPRQPDAARTIPEPLEESASTHLSRHVYALQGDTVLFENVLAGTDVTTPGIGITSAFQWLGMVPTAGGRTIYATGSLASPLAGEVLELRERLRALEEYIKNLTAVPVQDEKPIALRSLPREEAREEIIQLFRGGGVLDYGVIAETLQLDLPLVVDVCNELEKEGIVG